MRKHLLPTGTGVANALQFFALLLSLMPTLSQSANGLKPIGIGAESAAMGGADIAVVRDTTALHSNPAGLALIPGGLIDAYTGGAYPLDIRHRDELGNDVETKGVSPSLGYLGFARHLEDQPLSIGFGVLGQGAKVSYSDMRTIYGTRDNLFSQSEAASVSAGLAYGIDNRWSIGAAVTAIRVAVSQHVLPDTSFVDFLVPANSFFGFRMDEVEASGTGFRFGVMYQASSTLRWGLAYASRVDLTLTGNRFVSNQTALGLGNVVYQDVRLTGLRQPREIGSGVALQMNERLLAVIELNWIEWSDAITTTTLTVSQPNNPLAPSPLTVTTNNNWRDQYVLALGFAYALDAKTVLRLGYNYGRNPVPPETLSPLLAPIGERHLTFGFGREIAGGWRVDGGLEYLFPKQIRYTNPSSPFGPDAVEKNEGLGLHLSLARRW